MLRLAKLGRLLEMQGKRFLIQFAMWKRRTDIWIHRQDITAGETLGPTMGQQVNDEI